VRGSTQQFTAWPPTRAAFRPDSRKAPAMLWTSACAASAELATVHAEAASPGSKLMRPLAVPRPSPRRCVLNRPGDAVHQALAQGPREVAAKRIGVRLCLPPADLPEVLPVAFGNRHRVKYIGPERRRSEPHRCRHHPLAREPSKFLGV